MSFARPPACAHWAPARPARAPPEVAIDLAAQQQAEAEMLAAAQVALPDEEDDEL